MTHYPDIVIARSVGIMAIASGFILGIYGLDYPETIWLKIALALIVTGLLAQGYALVRSISHATRKRDEEQDL